MITWEQFLLEAKITPELRDRIIHLATHELMSMNQIVQQLASEGIKVGTKSVFKICTALPADVKANIAQRQKELTSQRGKKRFEDPAAREAARQQQLQRYSDPAEIESSRQRTAQLWQNDDYKEKLLQARQSDEARERASQQLKQQWEDPEFRDRMRQKQQDQWNDPAFRERQAERMRQQNTERWSDPAEREALSQRMIQHWEETGWWDWLAQFPPAKRIQIIKGMFEKGKRRDDRPSAPLQAMINKAMSL